MGFDRYIGQEQLKARLKTHIASALSRVKPLDHILLVGPSGCGKSTLAKIIAEEMHEPEFVELIMPVEPRVLERAVRDTYGIVFLDEIHRLRNKEQENLLTVLAGGYWQTTGGARIENDCITIIGATTEGDQLVDALYNRFPIKPEFDPYTDEEMAEIVKQHAEQEGLTFSEDTAEILGRATLGVPRNAKQLVVMARDMYHQDGTLPSADEILGAARITTTGLSINHVRYCEALSMAGGVAALDTMRTLLGLPRGTVEHLEIDLIRQRMIERTPRGRMLTGRGQRMVTYGSPDAPRRRNA